MESKAFDLQRKVKEESEDVRTMLSSLYKWEEEIKIKDENFKKQANDSKNSSVNEFPIRNKEPLQSADVNNGIQEISSKRIQKKTETSHQNRHKALYEKNKGNEFFKENNFEQAIQCYTTAIQHDPNDAILPANRAISFLKLNQFYEAVEDCNKSLKLDPKFVKAYHRRGTAYLKMGDVKSAKSDFAKVLQLEPHNKAAQIEMEKIQNMSAVELSSLTPPQGTVKKQLIAELQSPQSSNKPAITKNSSGLQNLSVTLEEYFEPVASQITSHDSATKIPVSIVKDEKEEQRALEKVIQELNANKKAESGVPAVVSSSEVSIDSIPQPPKNYFQFNQDWRRLQRYKNCQYQYLKQIKPSELPTIFRDSLETEVLGDVIKVMKQEFMKRKDPLVPWLVNLAQIKRISAITMFLSSENKTDLACLLKHVVDSKEGTEEDRRTITEKFTL